MADGYDYDAEVRRAQEYEAEVFATSNATGYDDEIMRLVRRAFVAGAETDIVPAEPPFSEVHHHHHAPAYPTHDCPNCRWLNWVDD